jgi:hypothetical protein
MSTRPPPAAPADIDDIVPEAKPATRILLRGVQRILLQLAARGLYPALYEAASREQGGPIIHRGTVAHHIDPSRRPSAHGRMHPDDAIDLYQMLGVLDLDEVIAAGDGLPSRAELAAALLEATRKRKALHPLAGACELLVDGARLRAQRRAELADRAAARWGVGS